MKRIISILSAIAISVVPLGTIVSCSSSSKIQDLFDDSDDSNKGAYLPENIKKKLNDFDLVALETFTTNEEINDSNKDVILQEMITKVEEKLNFKNDDFKIKLDKGDKYELPILKDLQRGQDLVTLKDIEQSKGTIKLSLYYLDNLQAKQEFSFTSSIFDAYSKIINNLSNNSSTNIVNNNAKKLDLSLISTSFSGMTINVTLGTILNILDLLNTLSSTGISKSLTEIVDTIKGIGNMDLNKLTTYNSSVYNDFNNKFEQSFNFIFKKLGDLLKEFGVPDEIELPIGEAPIKVKISEILNVNLLDVLGIDISKFNSDMITIKIEDDGGKNRITILDVLKNISPYVVSVINQIFVENSISYFHSSHNLLYSLLKFFTEEKNDNEVLSKIYNANFDGDSISLGSATSNIDMMFYDLLIGFDKERRDEKSHLRITIKVVYDINDLDISPSFVKDIIIKALGTDKLTIFNDDYLSKVLKYVKVTPSEIVNRVLQAIYKDRDGGLFDMNEENIVKDISTDDLIDINVVGLLNSIKELQSGLGQYASALAGTIKEKALPMINKMIAGVVPAIPIKPIISLLKDKIISSLVSDNKLLEQNDFELLSAKFQIALKDNDDWIKINNTIQIEDFSRYTSMKLIFTNVQYRVASKLDPSLVTKTRDDLTFDIVLSDLD
ncbi:hypothetical protein SCORR_v1c07840 [Spiroplasma corruscae]|uniref:MOLPALP family lipoprotein n=1 Tax=Spiroplasma corruscae TaxID=216934 RepID=A0A222EQ25_9MOLU|nr:hypothetical protein [Spiroplasma corruscae]ASP28556.1 hypothetical protein SCORR_v1c07840 [Spiroplasma corruscae]